MVFHRASSLSDLGRARREGISRLLIDPAELLLAAEPTPAAEWLQSFERWHRCRVVLVCRPMPELLRCVHTIATAVSSNLVLLGLDGPHELRVGLGLDEPQETWPSMEEVLKAAEAWPESVRAAVAEALQAPAECSAKRLASRAGTSKRSIERFFASAGLPGPGAVLRRFRQVADRR